MLCQFSFKNFYSYRDETVFDFQAATLPEFRDSLIQCENATPVLPVGVVYGPNGGGKSNLLKALTCLITTVVRPIRQLETTRTDFIVQQFVDSAPFLFDETSHNEPTEFLIYFRTKQNEFRYFLSLLNDEVVSESLDRKKIGGKRSAHIFDREGSVINLGASINKSSVNTSVNVKMPFFSFLAINYNFEEIVEAQAWFESCILLSYVNSRVEQSVLVTKDMEDHRSTVQFLNDMGVDIADYRYDKDEKMLYLLRNIGGNVYELPGNKESAGTQKLLAALPVIQIALKEGRLIVIDELDAKLHPKLLRYIISLFKNPDINRKGAQMLFSSHDMSTMKNTVFRRDEIWFAALDDNHSSILYSLHDIRQEDNERVKNTAAYDKQYLEGRYGADPYLQSMLSGGDWE